MKVVTIALLTFGFFGLQSQDIERQLQKQMWYVAGDIYNNEPFKIYDEQPSFCSGYLNFYKGGELEMFLEPSEEKFSCYYELQKDTLKLCYSIKSIPSNQVVQVLLFSRLIPLPGGRGFESIPVKYIEKKQAE